MKLSFFTYTFLLLTLDKVMTEHQKRFTIVSEYATARKFYPDIRITKPTPTELQMNLAYKEKICRDIVSSHYIHQRLAYLLDYKPPTTFAKFVGKRQVFFFGQSKFPKVTFAASEKKGEEFQEWVFVCPVRKRTALLTVEPLYISEEYKLGGDINSADNYVAGRFIFRFYANRIRLDGLAETIAEIVPQTLKEVERVYLERRTDSEPASRLEDDPLCSKKFTEKIRICTAIFTNRYFTTMMLKYPQNNWVSGACEKKTISFRELRPSADESAGAYEEWMMDCTPPYDEDKGPPMRFDFLLSHAYVPNEIFVYAKQRYGSIINLERRAVNIRFT